VVQRRIVADEQVLAAVATRFRFPVADMARVDARVAQSIPEQLARRFNVVPVGETDSYLEIATANPFDIDAEKVLAFATGREVRMLLASPSRLRDCWTASAEISRSERSRRRRKRPPAPKRRASAPSSGWST
jgi:type II secretory ATPase GspE/PulE/Tfp pilus assembly ATPase PilB-like protein